VYIACAWTSTNSYMYIYIYIYIHTYIYIYIYIYISETALFNLLLPTYVYTASAWASAHSYVCVCVCVYQYKCTPLDLAVKNKKEEAAAVLRAHGALHSLHFAAQKGMTDEVAAGIAAGQDVNTLDAVIYLCGCVEVASLVCTSFMYALLLEHSLDKLIISYNVLVYCMCLG
jgi:hypothetical protein